MSKSTRLERIAALAALTATIGCGAGGASSAPPPAGPKAPSAAAPEPSASAQGKPLDVEALLAREASGLTAQAVRGEKFRARVLAKGPPKISRDEHATRLDIPLGTQSEVTCLAFHQDPDPGTTLFNVLQNTKKVGEIKEVQILPAQVLNEAPAFGLSALYVLRQKQGNAVGELKLLHYAKYDQSVLCFHDEPGYRKTFVDVARSVFESQDRGIAKPNTEYLEISVARVNDVPAGFEKEEIVRDQNGNRKVVTLSLTMLMRSPTEMLARDAVSVTTIDAKGMVLDKHSVLVENGRPSLDVTLTRKQGNAYQFSGTHSGKKVSGNLKTKYAGGLVSGTEKDKEIARAFGRGGAFSIKGETYHPESDPTKTEDVVFEHAKTDPPRALRMKFGEVMVSGTADEHGRMQEGEMKLGPLTVTLKREFARGSP